MRRAGPAHRAAAPSAFDRTEGRYAPFARDEGEWTLEIPNEMARYGQTFGTKMGEVRWDIVAQGLGCQGELVQSIAELPAALERARHSDRPALVCVRTSTEANLAVPQEIVGRFFEVYFGPAA